jgi:disulfide bond formation protein DsbB
MKHIFPIILMLSFLLVACSGGSPEATSSNDQPGDPVAGKAAYSKTCTACHGPEAKGIPGLGKDLTTSEFVASKSDEELKEFIITGRPASDPLNSTRVDMPARGGNPSLTDQDLKNIVAFLRSVHQD